MRGKRPLNSTLAGNNVPTFRGAEPHATLQFPLATLLSRRTNIKSLAEIEAERKAKRPIQPPIIITAPSHYVRLTHEQKLERDAKIRELRLLGRSMAEISDMTGTPSGTVASVIVKLGLQGMGGKCKKFIKRRYKAPRIDGHP
jgi:hypothetical protein